MTTIHIPNCWICGRAVSSGNSTIDDNHLAVHESCYAAKMALEKGQLTLRPFHAQLVKTFEIVLGHRWYGSAFLLPL